MTQGDSLMALPSNLGRPPEFLIGGVEELVERETAMTELKVKDVEFKEDRVEVVRLVVNPHQIHSNRVDPYRAQGGHRH